MLTSAFSLYSKSPLLPGSQLFQHIIHKPCTPIFELAGNPVFSDHPEMHRMCVAVTSLNKIYFKFLVFNLLIKATILGGQNHKAVKCPRID